MKVRKLDRELRVATKAKDSILQVAGILAGVALILGGKACLGGRGKPAAAKAQSLSGLAQIMDAVDNRRTGVTIQHWGTVERTMPDDVGKLQKFSISLENGHSMLAAHDIGIARRVPMTVGDRIEFKGRFDWNAGGGLLYRTNHDPEMIFDDGWLRHNGKVYR